MPESLNEGDTAGRSVLPARRIIHLHPQPASATCWPAFNSCYSESDPRHKGDSTRCSRARRSSLRAEGYAVVSLSGASRSSTSRSARSSERRGSSGAGVTRISNGLLATPLVDRCWPLDGWLSASTGRRLAQRSARPGPRVRARLLPPSSGLRRRASGRAGPRSRSCGRDQSRATRTSPTTPREPGARSLQVRPVALAGRSRSLAERLF